MTGKFIPLEFPSLNLCKPESLSRSHVLKQSMFLGYGVSMVDLRVPMVGGSEIIHKVFRNMVFDWLPIRKQVQPQPQSHGH